MFSRSSTVGISVLTRRAGLDRLALPPCKVCERYDVRHIAYTYVALKSEPTSKQAMHRFTGTEALGDCLCVRCRIPFVCKLSTFALAYPRMSSAVVLPSGCTTFKATASLTTEACRATSKYPRRSASRSKARTNSRRQSHITPHQLSRAHLEQRSRTRRSQQCSASQRIR